MIKKHYYTWKHIEKMCIDIAMQMQKDDWKPDYIVGLTRGGNIPATILSNMMDVRCESLKVSLRDGDSENESNAWMAEDAFGYVSEEDRVKTKSRWDIGRRKNILIVDDINDTGATFNWIIKDWQSGCLPSEDSWNTVWGRNVRFAVLTDNMASETIAPVAYTAHEINKADEDVWLVYPWEIVGKYDA
jgi:hypoxanthine phosphoribosyltransferase|tara:strand:+ start:392 stop:955 length:564 start_codon:yes stop_codon:yes gene_type:complete